MMNNAFIGLLIGIILSNTTATEANSVGDPTCPSLILVSNWISNNVKIFDGCSGDYVRDLDNQNLINGPLGILETVGGDILVVSERNGRMIKFDGETMSNGVVVLGDDPTTTGVEDNFITQPSGAVIGNAGFMYASSFGSNIIVKIDVSTWEIVDTVLPADNGLVTGIDAGMAISSDDFLYVPGFKSDNVIKINLNTKVASVLVARTSGTLNGTRGILVREAENEIIVTSEYTNAMSVFDSNSGNFKNNFARIEGPTGMVQDGASHLLVNNANAVYRKALDGTSSVKVVQSGAGGLSQGTFVYRYQKKILDSDGDGISDDDETNIYGTDPTNPDTDGDNLSDGEEINTHGTDPLLSDTDNDGMPDDFEIANGLSPTVNDSSGDLDADGLSNLNEYIAGSIVNNPDTDGDGVMDGLDTDPLVPNSAPEITGAPDLLIDQNVAYSFVPSIVYAGDLATVSLSIENKPDWTSFNNTTGELSGLPTNDDIGVTNNIVITASNSAFDTSIPTFNLEVININDAPQNEGTIPNQNLVLGNTVSVNVAGYFSDIDAGDSLVYSATNLPGGVTLSGDVISGTPSAAATTLVTATATDTSGASVSSQFSIVVNNVIVTPPAKSSGGGGGTTAVWFLALLLFSYRFKGLK